MKREIILGYENSEEYEKFLTRLTDEEEIKHGNYLIAVSKFILKKKIRGKDIFDFSMLFSALVNIQNINLYDKELASIMLSKIKEIKLLTPNDFKYFGKLEEYDIFWKCYEELAEKYNDAIFKLKYYIFVLQMDTRYILFDKKNSDGKEEAILYHTKLLREKETSDGTTIYFIEPAEIIDLELMYEDCRAILRMNYVINELADFLNLENIKICEFDNSIKTFIEVYNDMKDILLQSIIKNRSVEELNEQEKEAYNNLTTLLPSIDDNFINPTGKELTAMRESLEAGTFFIKKGNTDKYHLEQFLKRYDFAVLNDEQFRDMMLEKKESEKQWLKDKMN